MLLLIAAPLYCIGQTTKLDSLVAQLATAKEDTARVNLYASITSLQKFTDPEKAMEYGRAGFALSQKLGFDKGTAACYLGVSTAYIYSDKLDTALLYLDTALVFAHKVDDPNRLGLAYLNRADIYRQMRNFTQSLKDCETALQYADKAGNDDVRARVNQTFGSVYMHQNIYPESIVYIKKAIVLYRKIGNFRMSAAALNNLGMLYKLTKDFSNSIEVTKEAIHITDSLKDITNQSIYNGNMADLYFEMAKYEESLQYADKAMEYAVLQKNETLIAIAQVLKGNVYVKQKRLTEAVDILSKAMEFFIADGEIDRISNTGDLLAEAYALSGNYGKAYEYIKISKSASDSITKEQYNDEIAALQTKFQVKEKDQEILLLAKDKELQTQKLQRQRLLMGGAILLALLALGGTWMVINRNRLKQQMKELELRNQIAADLHDEVGSSLSSIHMLSQMAARPGNEATHQDILHRMSSNAKETMDKMGDIVWMIKPGETEAGSLKQRMERFAYEIAGSKNIAVSLQLEELDKIKLSMEQRKNIYLIFKEAVNNAVKYSGTEKIFIEATTTGKTLTLLVKDEGIGFEDKKVKKGNGLDNMQNRAKELNAALQLQSVAGKGTAIRLEMPV
jgi:two-component system, NarL family, sensor histidine kinase UhpB